MKEFQALLFPWQFLRDEAIHCDQAFELRDLVVTQKLRAGHAAHMQHDHFRSWVLELAVFVALRTLHKVSTQRHLSVRRRMLEIASFATPLPCHVLCTVGQLSMLKTTFLSISADASTFPKFARSLLQICMQVPAVAAKLAGTAAPE